MTPHILNPNSIEWNVAFKLGYWRGLKLHYRSRGEEDLYSAGHASAYVSLARMVVAKLSAARRRAFGATVRSALRQTLEYRRRLESQRTLEVAS